MNSALPKITLVRHGETEWSAGGKHTGRTDIPLTEKGAQAARQLSDKLRGLDFAAIWSSPSERARRTCELAEPGMAYEVLDELAEWDYGAYEGLTTRDILAKRPGWQLFRDGCPGGEDAAAVGARADTVIREATALDGDLLIFSSAHFLRVLAARWIGLPPQSGALFFLDTASISVLGYEHDRTEPVIRRWNQP